MTSAGLMLGGCAFFVVWSIGLLAALWFFGPIGMSVWLFGFPLVTFIVVLRRSTPDYLKHRDPWGPNTGGDETRK